MRVRRVSRSGTLTGKRDCFSAGSGLLDVGEAERRGTQRMDAGVHIQLVGNNSEAVLIDQAVGDRLVLILGEALENDLEVRRRPVCWAAEMRRC